MTYTIILIIGIPIAILLYVVVVAIAKEIFKNQN